MKKMPAIGVAGIFVRGFVRGESRDQGALFPVSLDELVPENYACRVIDALVDSLDLLQLEFLRAEAAVTRRPVYDPADLLKLYLNGFLRQVRGVWSGSAPRKGSGASTCGPIERLAGVSVYFSTRAKSPGHVKGNTVERQ